MKSVTIELEEEERQSVLLALAMLSLAQPAFDIHLNRIALKMDEAVMTLSALSSGDPRAQLYDYFRSVHRQNAERIRAAMEAMP
jgi:hypothetical protein